MEQPSGLIGSLIDTAAFYGANVIAHSFYPEDKVKMEDAFIFLLSDVIVRNSVYASGILNSMGYDEDKKRNLTIALLYVGVKTADGYARNGELHIMQNIIKGAVGFVGNTLVDKLISPALV